MWQYFRAGRCILCISYCSQQPCQRGERTHRRIFIRTPDQQKKDSHGKTDLCLVPASDIECDRVPISLIGEEILWKEICLLHLAYFLIQIELAGICFGISAFLRRSGLGIGLGIATMMYFLNIIANISDQAKFLKYITPFGYANGADIVENGSLDTDMVLTGMLFAVIGILTAYWKYSRKDIQA